MATCSFVSLAHVTSPCGSSLRDPQDVQRITLSECNEDVSTHLKKLNVGPDTINDEKTLLKIVRGIPKTLQSVTR